MEKIGIYCKNTGKYYQVEPGTKLVDLMEMAGCDALAAYVDNQLKELGFPMYMPHSVEFLDYSHSDGRRCYKRSIYFLLQKAVKELYPDKQLVLDYTLPNGGYGEIVDAPAADNLRDSLKIRMESVMELSEEEVAGIKIKMQEIVAEDIPIVKKKVSNM